MMRAANGLIWEEWRRTRKLTGMSMVLLAGIAVVPWYFDRGGGGTALQFYRSLSYGLLGAFIIYLTLSQSTKSDLQAGIPRRRYLLPVSTLELVFWPLAFRLALVTTLASLMAVFAIWLYDSNQPHFVITCCVITVASLATMFAWCARLVGKTVTCLGFFLLIVPGVGLMIRYMDTVFLPSPWLELLLPVVAVVVTAAASTLAISIVRSGGWGSRLPPKTPSKAATSAVPAAKAKTDHKPFPSMLLAQIWYEWRSMGLKMTLLIICPTCAFLLTPLLTSQIASIQAVLLFGSQLLLLLCVPAGLWAFVRHDTNARRGVARFAHTRCVDDSLIAWAKLGSSAATVLGSSLVMILFACLSCAIFLLLGPGFGDRSAGATGPSLASSAGMGMMMLSGVWILYTRGGFVVSVAIVVLSTNGGAYGLWRAAHDYFWDRTDPTDVPLMLNLTLLVCVLFCLASFVLALQRRVISSRSVAALAVAWFTLSVLGTAMLLSFELNLPEFGLATFAAWVAGLTLLGLTPFATTALQVHRLRHR